MKILFLFLLSFNCFAWSTGASIFPVNYGNKEICEAAGVIDCVYLFGDISIYKVLNNEVVVDSAQESAYTVIRNAEIAKENFEAEIAKKQADMRFGERIIAMVRISGEVKNLSDAQKNIIKSSMTSIDSELHDGRIKAAKVLIEAITPDGVLVTSADKSMVLSEINTYLGE